MRPTNVIPIISSSEYEKLEKMIKNPSKRAEISLKRVLKNRKNKKKLINR